MGEKKRRLAAANVRSERHASRTAQLLYDAEQAHRAHRFQDARAFFQEVLETDPQQAYAWRGLAMLAWHDGALDKALPFLAKAVELAPEVDVFRWQYGCGLQEMQRFAAAEEQFRAACRLRPMWLDIGRTSALCSRRLEKPVRPRSPTVAPMTCTPRCHGA